MLRYECVLEVLFAENLNVICIQCLQSWKETGLSRPFSTTGWGLGPVSYMFLKRNVETLAKSTLCKFEYCSWRNARKNGKHRKVVLVDIFRNEKSRPYTSSIHRVGDSLRKSIHERWMMWKWPSCSKDQTKINDIKNILQYAITQWMEEVVAV